MLNINFAGESCKNKYLEVETKMKTIKRTLAVLLTLLMLIGVVPLGMMNVSAADEWVNSGSAVTVERVKAWPTGSSATSGFCTSNALYTKYNKSIPSNTSTTRYNVTKEETIGYLYWHWCYSHDVGQPINCAIKGSKNQTIPKYDANGNPAGYYYTNNFHAFFSASKLNYVSSAYAFQHSNAKDCPYTYWWVSNAFNAQGNHNSHLAVVRTTYQKQVKTTTTQSHIVTYNYLQNGGSSATKLVDAVEEGAAIDLTPTATKSGSTFVGWNTNASATTALSSLKMGTSDVTLYAIFKTNTTNIYNRGEETYSFQNYSYCLQKNPCNKNGHCFGMSVTSSAYYLNKLNISNLIGISSSNKLFTASLTPRVKEPICYYQSIQGVYAKNAIVAGGSYYKGNCLVRNCDINSDWNAVVNYVKNHSYDNKGSLQFIFWGFYKWQGANSFGGHAVNFLYYKEVNGQQRIYAYDNNFPNVETYFYRSADGKVHQAPNQTLDVSIESVSFHDLPRYLNSVSSFNKARVVYANEGVLEIEGAQMTPMVSSLNGVTLCMYEIPENVTEVTVIPQTINATFSYMGEDYSFDIVNAGTVGRLTLVSENASASTDGAHFVIEDEKANICKWCGGQHEGFFQGIIGFFHRIFAALFGAKY